VDDVDCTGTVCGPWSLFCAEYPIVSIEDPFDQDDFEVWASV
jgi:enolase